MKETDLSIVTEQNLQQHLVDIRMPDPINWWPVAPGWWIAIVLLLISLLLVVWRFKRPRNSALKVEADNILAHLHANGDAALYWHRMTRLLRETAVKGGERIAVARLQGTEWVAWLEDANGKLFSAKVSKLLSDECYRKSPSMPDKAVHNELVNWLDRYVERDELKANHRA